MRRVFLDTETTGFGADKNRIVSVGAVAYNDRDIISGDGGEFDCYVNPPCAMEEGAQKTHGLSEEFLADFPPFAERAEDIAAFPNAPRTASDYANAEFDEGFLNAEFARLKMPPLAKVAAKVVCSLILARRMQYSRNCRRILWIIKCAGIFGWITRRTIARRIC